MRGRSAPYGSHSLPGRPAAERVSPLRFRLIAAILAALLLLGLTAVVARPVRADGAEADRAAAAAHDAAQHWRNAEAVVLFQRAIALDPSRRLEWQRELADALSLSDRARQAVPLYREVLASGKLSPADTRWARLGLARALQWSGHLSEALRECDALSALDPNDIDVRVRRAQVLLWLDRKGDAKKEYEAILKLDPNNPDALRSLGQVKSWQGRQRDAQRWLTAFMREHPEDAEGSLMLAQAQQWMGRSDRAQQTLEGLLTQHPDDERGKELLDQLRLNEQPDAGVDYQFSTQSDHVDIAVQSYQQNTQLEDGRSTLGVRFQRYDYSPPQGQAAVSVNRPGFYARRRLSDRSEVNGSFYLDMIDPEGNGKSRSVLTYDTYYTLWPNDRFRLDLGSRRLTFDNITSLNRGISATYGTYSIDFLPDEATRLTTRGDWGAYTDSNSRRFTQVEAERRVWPNPHLYLGARFTDIAFAKMLDNGYYNPDSYRSAVLTAHVWGDGGQRFHYDIDGAYGREHANPGGGKPYSSFGTRLSYRIGQRMQIEGRWQFFSSRQAAGTGAELSSSGFARHTLGLFLRVIM